MFRVPQGPTYFALKTDYHTYYCRLCKTLSLETHPSTGAGELSRSASGLMPRDMIRESSTRQRAKAPEHYGVNKGPLGRRINWSRGGLNSGLTPPR